MKTFARIFLVLPVILIIISGCVQQNDSLKLIIEMGSEVYAISDQLNITMSLINQTDDSIIVNHRMIVSDFGIDPLGEVSFIIHTPSDELAPLTWWGYIEVPKMEDFSILEPGDLISNNYELGKYYSQLGSPGEYTVQAIYRNQWDPSDSAHAWQGEIYSNVITFSISP